MLRFATCLIVLALLAAVLTGCTRVSPTPPTGAGRPKTEITLFTWTPRNEEQVDMELIKQFEATHPNLSVRLQNETAGSQQAMAKLQTMIAAKAAPDVMSLHGAFFIPLASKGALMDLEARAKQDPAFKLADFHAALLDVCRWEGRLMSFPRYTSVYATFFNKTLFDEARVPHPGSQGAWTWDEFLKTAKALTKDTNGDGTPDQFGCVIDFWGARLYPWLWQNGASLMNADRSQCVLDSPAAVEALTFLYDLRHKHKCAAITDNAEKNAALNAFTRGNVAMYMTGPWDIQALRQATGLQWDVAPLPAKKTQATMLGTENYAIWSGTQHPQEAWELFAFLLSAETQQKMADKLEKMPSRTSVLQGPYAQAQAGYSRKVFVESLQYARQAENIPEWSQVKDLIQDQLDLAWVGKKGITAALKDATASVNKTLAQLRAKK